jgi:hypothetical protein
MDVPVARDLRNTGQNRRIQHRAQIRPQETAEIITSSARQVKEGRKITRLSASATAESLQTKQKP